MSTQANDAAYPIANGVLEWQGGLTKREYFAAMALQGMLADRRLYHPDDMESACSDAVKMADELINKLNQTK